jgi:hypothetical protein
MKEGAKPDREAILHGEPLWIANEPILVESRRRKKGLGIK